MHQALRFDCNRIHWHIKHSRMAMRRYCVKQISASSILSKILNNFDRTLEYGLNMEVVWANVCVKRVGIKLTRYRRHMQMKIFIRDQDAYNLKKHLNVLLTQCQETMIFGLQLIIKLDLTIILLCVSVRRLNNVFIWRAYIKVPTSDVKHALLWRHNQIKLKHIL